VGCGGWLTTTIKQEGQTMKQLGQDNLHKLTKNVCVDIDVYSIDPNGIVHLWDYNVSVFYNRYNQEWVVNLERDNCVLRSISYKVKRKAVALARIVKLFNVFEYYLEHLNVRS
jgi:hypothetical protein